MESERDATQDLSQDQTFASATDETPFHASDCSLNEDLPDSTAGEETQVIETANSRELHETTYVSLNQTDTLGSSKGTLSIQDPQFVPPYPVEKQIVSQAEESIDKYISSRESDNILVNRSETCGIVSNIIEDLLPTNNVNVTTIVSLDDSIPNTIGFDEEQKIENERNVEILENPKLCPVEVSVPSISSLTQYAEDPSLPSISSISLSLEDTDTKLKENSTQDLSQSGQGTSLTALSLPDDIHQKLCVSSQININNPVVQPEENKIIEEQGSPRLDNCVASDNQEDSKQLNKTSIIEPKILEVKENLQTNVDREDLEITDNAILNKTQIFSPEKEICNETHIIEKQCNPSETVIIVKEENIVDSAVSTDAIKKKETVEEDLDRTLTLQEIDENFALDEEQYQGFKPQRQSTTLSLINEQPDFEEFKFTAEKVTDELLNPSQGFAEETDQFTSATDESKCISDALLSRFLFANL